MSFRKILPDQREACEPEFVTLLKRTKVPATINQSPREREAYPQGSEGDCAARTVAGAPSGLSHSPVSQAKPLIDYRKNNRDGGTPNKLPPSNT